MVELPESHSTVATILECDIKPGALVQRYYVQWMRHNNFTLVISNEFNFTLGVNTSTDGSEYQCEVTVDHDSNVSTIYKGATIIIIVSVQGLCIHIHN